MGRGWRHGPLRALALLSALGWGGVEVAADIDNVFPVFYSSDPVARHVACGCPAGTATVCNLAGHQMDGLPLQFFVESLPSTGSLFETSQNFRSYGTAPFNGGTAIQVHQLPYLITDATPRVVYVPPADVFPPDGRWASFRYRAKEPINASYSEDGMATMANPLSQLAGSSFIAGDDGWGISGNIHNATPGWQPFGWGLLDRYIYAVDEVQFTDFETDSDRAKWYFEAPAGKYHLPELAPAYGGILRFRVSSTYGDFSRLNDPLDWVTFECDSCDSGRGLRIVRNADNGLQWNGEERVVEIPLAEGNYWVRDPLNRALPFTNATACEIAAVLAGVTKFKILGDFTQAGEGIALDDVAIVASPNQPEYPLECQQGCTCPHHPETLRLSCCGSFLDSDI